MLLSIYDFLCARRALASSGALGDVYFAPYVRSCSSSEKPSHDHDEVAMSKFMREISTSLLLPWT
jgi:hypothetical protein